MWNQLTKHIYFQLVFNVNTAKLTCHMLSSSKCLSVWSLCVWWFVIMCMQSNFDILMCYLYIICCHNTMKMRSKNFDKRPNHSQKIIWWRKLHCECVERQQCITDTLAKWPCMTVHSSVSHHKLCTSVSSLWHHSVGHTWMHTGDEFLWPAGCAMP